MKRIEVVAAVIVRDGKVLATQRGYGEFKGKWEFPGGKIEAGESREDALVREIHEELDAAIRVDDFIGTVDYDYPAFHLTMHCYACSLREAHVTLLEHESACWSDVDGLSRIDWLPADLLIIDRIREYLSAHPEKNLASAVMNPEIKRHIVLNIPHSAAAGLESAAWDE